ncbi:YgiT-type zinc finger protein [Nostoc sp.]
MSYEYNLFKFLFFNFPIFYKDLLVIKNIPVITCADCGETYLTAETLQKI